MIPKQREDQICSMGQTREFILYIAVVTIALPVEFLLSSLNANLTQQKIYPIKVVLIGLLRLRNVDIEEEQYQIKNPTKTQHHSYPQEVLNS